MINDFIDWTEHAGTALFFAVENCKLHNADGAVWCSELLGDANIGLQIAGTQVNVERAAG